jgi:putative membrane protein
MGIILIIIVVGLVVWLINQNRETGRGLFTTTASGTETALEVLRQRYARGEIDRAEYEARKQDLL